MKRVFKVLIWVLGISVVIFFVLVFVTDMYGKKVITQKIEENTKLKSSIESVKLEFPLKITINKLELGDLAKIDKLSFCPNLLGFLAGKIVLDSLVVQRAQVNLIRHKDGSFNLPKLDTKGSRPPVFLTGLSIENAKLVFADQGIEDQGYQTIIDQLNLKIAKVMLPITSLHTDFNLSFSVYDAQLRKIGFCLGGGWIDFSTKDMDANFEIRDMDVTHFSVYYGDFISRKKLLSAKFNLTTAMKAKNNDLKISSSIKFSGLVYAKEEPPQEGQPPELDIAKNALDLFTDSHGDLNLDFTINTELDHPAVSVKELKRIMLNAAMKNLSSQNPEQIIEKIQSAVGNFKDFGKKMKGIFKEKQQ